MPRRSRQVQSGVIEITDLTGPQLAAPSVGHLRVSLGNTSVVARLSTGSGISYMSKKQLYRLIDNADSFTFTADNRRLVSVVRTPVQSMGCVMIRVTVGTLSKQLLFAVMDNAPLNVVLGNDFVHKFLATTDTRAGRHTLLDGSYAEFSRERNVDEDPNEIIMPGVYEV